MLLVGRSYQFFEIPSRTGKSGTGTHRECDTLLLFIDNLPRYGMVQH